MPPPHLKDILTLKYFLMPAKNFCTVPRYNPILCITTHIAKDNKVSHSALLETVRLILYHLHSPVKEVKQRKLHFSFNQPSGLK